MHGEAISPESEMARYHQASYPVGQPPMHPGRAPAPEPIHPPPFHLASGADRPRTIRRGAPSRRRAARRLSRCRRNAGSWLPRRVYLAAEAEIRRHVCGQRAPAERAGRPHRAQPKKEATTLLVFVDDHPGHRLVVGRAA
ncbi:hypothetical protein L1887_43984 [Cichorium endivia]|nr:hypothetical protein L1887_43984 [Cichorium endivia]